MKTWQLSARLFLPFVAASLLGGCGQPPAEKSGGATTPAGAKSPAAAKQPAAPSDGPIVIAVAGPFTGDSAELGLPLKMGTQLGAEKINAAGGINGRKIELRIEDDAGNSADAQNVATRVASDPRVIAVIGHYNSSCSLAAKGAYTEAKIVMLSPASTNVTVTKDSDYVYRNIFTDDFQGQSLADYIAGQLGLKRVAVLYDNDDYGTGLKESFRKRAGELGLEVVSETAFARETTDFRSQLETVRSSTPDIILIAGLYKQAAVIATQARELGINTRIIGGDGLFSPGYISLAGAAAEGTLVTCPFLFEIGGERAQKFAEEYRARWNKDPDAWAALGYDAFQIIVEAIKKNGPTREGILNYLKSVNSPETAFDGLTGKTYFDAEGDCKKAVQVAQVKNGKFVAAEKQLTDAAPTTPPAPKINASPDLPTTTESKAAEGK
ncbi:MAG: ABC transporter substrate-binding protein [Candidatus Sumerlaeaceae bacterium]|nr:ABC transporter substrate-binding protein [Candidatus Sumerlaeaceae bacterium]